VEDFNNRKLIAVGTLFTIFVFIGYGVAPNWIFLVPVQFLLAMGFSALQVGVFQELLQKHEAKAVVSANLNAVVNFSAVVGPLLGGLVSQLYGYRINMFCAAVIAAASFLTIGGTKRLPIRF
jgi:predicted MFS family arabinose efflux permease